MAWNTHRHMETWYGIMGIGAVCHTLNPRLFIDQLVYIANHADDKYLFVDLTFVPLCVALQDKCPRIKGFVVMSNKKNIEKYKNPRLDDDNKAWIYWFLTRLLLERVTAFCAQFVPKEREGQEKLRIIFSRRGDLTYKDFTDYLWKMYYERGNQVLGYKELDWSVIDFDEIYTHNHGDKAGLQLSDVIAGSFFQAVELNRGDQVECDPSYAKLLKPLMHHNGRRWYLGFGVKPMPMLSEMDLTNPQTQIFTFYGANSKSWKKR